MPLTECFFTIHTPSRQSWRGHRIAPLNPGVGAGLLHSILVWAQDCPGVSQILCSLFFSDALAYLRALPNRPYMPILPTSSQAAA